MTNPSFHAITVHAESERVIYKLKAAASGNTAPATAIATQLPPWFRDSRKMPKWNGKQNLSTCPGVLRKLRPGHSPLQCVAYRDFSLTTARRAYEEWARLREKARQLFGDSGGINPTPISGGICADWPREVSNEVVRYLVRAQGWRDIAYAWHLYAGKRHSTFYPALNPF